MPPVLVPDGNGRDRHLGALRPGKLDPRDALLVSSPALSKRLPARIDWSADAPKVRDQGQDGTCTGHMIRNVALYETYALQPQLQIDPDFDLSPLFSYVVSRQEEDTPLADDDGASIRGAFQALTKEGICKENLWPYGPNRYMLEPPPEAFSDALQHQALAYIKCANVDTVKLQLARGYLVGFGMDCPPSLMQSGVAKTGLLPWDGGPSQGGHAITIIGYDDAVLGDGALRVRNSWGADWGLDGDFWMSYRYFLEGRASDARSLLRIEI